MDRFIKSSLIVAALALSGPTGCSDSNSPTIVLPVPGPSGAEGILADFVEICSTAIVETSSATNVIAQRGWSVPDLAEAMEASAFGMIAAEREDITAFLQIMPVTFPHLEGTACSMNILDTTAAADIDIAPLGTLDGFTGGIDRSLIGHDSLELGRWSAIAPDGSVIALSATRPSDQFLLLTMTATRQVTP